jgi:hypothetical protein
MSETNHSPGYSHLLEAAGYISAFDGSVFENLSKNDTLRLTTRAFVRLSLLLHYFGSEAPEAFISEISDAASNDIVRITGAYLRLTDDVANELPQLQQELVHFSRIVDVDPIFTNSRRLQRSSRIPLSLKFLCELASVMRGRLLGTGRHLNSVDRTKPTLTSLSSRTLSMTWRSSVLYITAGRRRALKQAAFYFQELCQYLPAEEAFYVFVGYVVGDNLSDFDVDLTLIDRPGPDLLTYRHWKFKPWSANDPLKTAHLNLPSCRQYNLQEEKLPFLVSDFLCVRAKDELHVHNYDRITVLLAPIQGVLKHPRVNNQVTNMISAFGHFSSVECGHIHLDRKIDADQEFGMEIGRTIYGHLRKTQRVAPAVTPLMDDDHVFASLKPEQYEKFLSKHFDTIPYSLIPESSPIVRGIASAVFDVLLTEFSERIVRQGKHHYFKLDEEHFCELIEGTAPRPTIGCVLFEVSLLIYRANMSLYNKIFERLVGFGDAHAQICAALNLQNAKESMSAIDGLRSSCDFLGDPFKAHTEFKAALAAFRSSNVTNHLNVLEDYYETQQEKVRSLLAVLNFPIKLVTIHFNSQSGRIHCVP